MWTFGSASGQKNVYIPVYGPTKQETMLDHSRELDEARSTYLSVRCKHAPITIYLAS